ncbi:bifunctional ADP-dependent NAD(P)H-hydrate dehydratase/NAD(P)H-hydrate epimerase [Solitalea canadensis]|uniref:Bifunctional NAD(P)H-hydrate repair enzyme n=1 Tax=Solitalea canadensis (strain ATCC 29591 / DSM 3403 / JCM 21819 / LMG 8368 / NBRC 15130 / NCIMB 12057 / USAM 9D) TaxID=929556 RepID=H8KMV9_SOLCM|nr:bifunctional ADP-dependent NAD(P)H-hydrate dehydratase/NAD(P)H-hydrate epimerase [Solitalea canadensis]AFD09362.1 yjeF-like protein, hydroxyethylthiazole kinase-related protein [Solitalea canadensis DSM 3403]
MKKIISATQTREADAYTIAHEPIASIDLMERASKAFVQRFMIEVPHKHTSIAVYCGTGNNGGDGLAVARLLNAEKYRNISVIILQHSFKTTPDFEENLRRLKKTSIQYEIIQDGMEFPPNQAEVIIDAILGSGLNKPLEGSIALWVEQLNGFEKNVIAVDIPTGMFADQLIDKDAVILKSDLVISFQRPKLNFLLPESSPFIKQWEVVDIGLDEHFIQHCVSDKVIIEEADIKEIIRVRDNFSYKGTYGHTLIIAGQPETMGAALLCAEASLNTGSGLTTAFIPASGLTALNSRLPEVMAIPDDHSKIDWKNYDAIAIGPGLGKNLTAKELLSLTLQNFRGSIVLDADALNMLSDDQLLFNLLPEQSIITPHVKEFDRLFGEHFSWHSRLITMQEQARERDLIIVLKNRYTIIATPNGSLYFNLTGTPAMATGGSGDVLTGVIASLLAQGYFAPQAAIAGVYLHGKAGCEIVRRMGINVIPASQLATEINKVMYSIVKHD